MTLWSAPGVPDSRAQALTDYVAAVDAGRSVVVRPSTPYEGLPAVVDRVAALAGGPIDVTDLAGIAETHRPPPTDAPSGDALLAYHTSGSTGLPKCVVYRRGVADRHAATIAEVLGLADAPYRHVSLTPPHFAYGLSIVHSHRAVDVPVAFLDPDWGLPALSALAGGGPVAIYALPQHAPLLLSSHLDGDLLRRLIVAGGRLSTSAARSLAERFPRADLVNMYGQAELGPRLAMWRGPLVDFVEGTIGRALPGVSLAIRAGDETPCGPGELGRIHARTPYAMSWIIAPPHTEPTPGPRPGSWVDTRDRGALTTHGDIRHEGRADHVINVAGTKVDGSRLRQIVEESFEPLVVRVSSRPARVGGDRVPVLEIVPGDAAMSVGAVRRALHAEIGSLAGLCIVTIVDRLHLTESGK